MKQDESLHRTLKLPGPLSQTSQPPACEKYISVVYKPATWWHFVLTTQIDQDISEGARLDFIKQELSKDWIAQRNAAHLTLFNPYKVFWGFPSPQLMISNQWCDLWKSRRGTCIVSPLSPDNSSHSYPPLKLSPRIHFLMKKIHYLKF